MSDGTLQGWNAIAEFLSCDVRTAKRWEQYRQLPVHRTRRTPGEGRANVYALTSELEAWLASANAQPEIQQQPEITSPLQTSPPAEFAVTRDSPADISTFSPDPVADPTLPRFRPRWVLIALSLGLIAATGITVWAAHRFTGTARAAHETPTIQGRPAVPVSPQDAHAQELYLHGSYLFEQRTPETLQQAVVDFQAAIAASPQYAPAYAGLAKTYDLLREYATLPSNQAYPMARQAALKAIALDPNLPDAHAALGYEEFFWEWDASHAEAEFKQAIALDPTSTIAHHWYGSMLMHQTRFPEALDQLNQAQMLEPASAGVLGSRAYALGLSGKRDEAADLLQDILTRVPDSAPLHFVLARLCLEQPRDIPRYLDQMRRFAELRHSEEQLAVVNAGETAYRNQGERKMWEAMLQVERRLYPNPEQPIFFVAELESDLGMKDAALQDLSRLLHNHDEQMIGLEIDTALSPLRSDPRFAQIVRRVGLPYPPQTAQPPNQ